MTISTQTNKDSFSGTGANTALATTFPFIDATDLIVTKRVTATGVETTLTLNTHYTVTGGSYAVGVVTPVDGATDFPTTVTWTITRAVPKNQLTDYVENDNFGAETHEKAIDKLTMITVDRQEQIDRSLKVAVTDADPGTIPNSVDRALKYLGFDANGDPIPLSAPVDSALVSSFGETLIDDVDAATARATLDAVQNVLTTRGDIIRRTAAAEARLALGSSGEYLRSNGVDPVWSALVRADVEAVQGLPEGYLFGLEITRTSATEFNVGVGKCRGGTSADQDLMDGVNTNSAFGKLFDNGGWDDGDGGGGVPTAAGFATAVDTWHFFMLIKQDGAKVDFGWDTSLTAVNLIADAAVQSAFSDEAPYYRRLHSFVSTATPDFADFTQIGDEILLAVPVLDYDDVTQDITSAETVTLASVPDGIRVKALLRIMKDNSAEGEGFVLRSADESDAAPSVTVAPGSMLNTASGTAAASTEAERWTNTSRQVFMRQQTDATTDNFIVTRGWIDRRGRDG